MTPSKSTYPPGHKIQKTPATPSKPLPDDDASAKTASPTPSPNPQAPQDTYNQQPPITTNTTTTTTNSTLPAAAATSRSRAQRNNRKRHHYLNYLTCRPQPDQIQHSLQILFPQPPSYISFPADSRILAQPNATAPQPHDEIMLLKEQISGMQMLMNQMMLQQQQMAVEMARLVMAQKEGLFSNCRAGDHHLRHNSDKSDARTKPEGFQARNEVDDFFLVSDESEDGFDF
ncbi:hypothetical protein BJ741DRAFT_589206 [Chytriomyces cf. hyalinus JEL632]|nr:hypothetical protein BJ741DRAFT_589206 [Chytriomyces cf. hyalinus JEL632]